MFSTGAVASLTGWPPFQMVIAGLYPSPNARSRRISAADPANHHRRCAQATGQTGMLLRVLTRRPGCCISADARQLALQRLSCPAIQWQAWKSTIRAEPLPPRPCAEAWSGRRFSVQRPPRREMVIAARGQEEAVTVNRLQRPSGPMRPGLTALPLPSSRRAAGLSGAEGRRWARGAATRSHPAHTQVVVTKTALTGLTLM